jgi:cytochrome c553
MSRSFPAVFAAFVLLASACSASAQLYEERLPACLACHGEQGRSETENVPSLGGQPAPYLLIQLYMFREKLRLAEPMNDMAADLSDAELQRFADTMSKLPPPAAAGAPDPAPAERVKTVIAQHRCGFCHGATFAGADSVPRLAGQREDYLLIALQSYKGGQRREYQPIMAEIVRPLSDEVLADLAHYLSRLP